MFFDTNPKAALSPGELDEARKGFKGKLSKAGFSSAFIARNGEEMLAMAQVEYARHIAKGTVIENPAGWIALCAWHRTQNLLRKEGRRPRTVSIERLGELPEPERSDEGPGAENSRRAIEVQRAIEELGLEERQVIALIYFEGVSCREASRMLRWSHSKAVRRERSALRALREVLGERSCDQLGIEIGLIAWLSLASASEPGSPGRLEAVVERATHWGWSAWTRGGELARRLLGGGSEAAGAVTASGAGRAIGVCASAVALTCFASTGGFIAAGGSGGSPAQGNQSHRIEGIESMKPARGARLPLTALPDEETPVLEGRRSVNRDRGGDVQTWSPPPHPVQRESEGRELEFGIEAEGPSPGGDERLPPAPAPAEEATPRPPSTAGSEGQPGPASEFAL